MAGIRHFAGHVIGRLLFAAGLVSRRIDLARSEACLTHIYFHQPSAAVFSEAVTWLLKQGFSPISIAQLEASMLAGEQLPGLPLVVSLDDAWRSNLTEVVPVAQRLDVPIAIFVPTEPIRCGHYWWTRVERFAQDEGRTVERLKRVSDEERRLYVDAIPHVEGVPREAMTVEELREIAALKQVTIGSHTVNHPVLVKCDPASLRSELDQSKAELEGWLGTAISTFSYPNGDFGERERLAVQRAGYRIGFTTEQRHQQREFEDPLMLPRFALLNDASDWENVARATGAWRTRETMEVSLFSRARALR